MRERDIKTEFEIAYGIAKEAHARQTDIAGVPYMKHIDAVVAGVNGEKEKAVAALHDVLEDASEWTTNGLLENGISSEVVTAVVALTKISGENYTDYLERVKTNKLARAVKLSDLTHNSNIDRIDNPQQRDFDRQNKYKNAIDFLSRSS